MNRRGFTLIELMITLVLLGVIGVALYNAIIGAQRVSKTQVERIDVQQTTRAATYYLSGALRELDANDGDILLAGPNQIRFRAMRWARVLCSPVALLGSEAVFVVRNDFTVGQRLPDAAQDSIFLFADGDLASRGDDQWLEGGLRRWGPAAACADGLTPGTSVRVEITAASGGNPAAVTAVTSGSPIRGYQLEALSVWNDAGADWVGRQTMDRGGSWSATEALVGPVQAQGLGFTYFDNTGAVTAALTNIAAVGLTVRGRSMGRARISGGNVDFVRDSIITRVALRNNRRF